MFGIDATELENKFYPEALKYKLDSGRKLHMKLDVMKDTSFEHRERLFYVGKAIEFTEELILEVEGFTSA